MSTRQIRQILVPIFVGLIIIGIIVVAIFYPPSGTLVCNLSGAPGDPHADYVYTIRFKMWKANDLEIKQVITSDNKKLLSKLEDESNAVKTKYEGLSFYKRSVKKDKKSLTSITSINYQEIDYDALALVEGEKKVTEYNRSINNIKKSYQKNGAKCSYK